MNTELFEFFCNYAKLAMMAIEAYVGRSKINSAKKWGLNKELLCSTLKTT